MNLNVIDVALAPLVDLLPEPIRRKVYGWVAVVLGVVTVLVAVPSLHLPAWVAAVSTAVGALSGLLATANTNVKTPGK